jgi:photoactive yellow protein
MPRSASQRFNYKKFASKTSFLGELMPDAKVDFEAPDLAVRIERLSQHDLDQLPFGVILLDVQGIVQFYSTTEARQSGYGKLPLGENFFEVSRCAGKGDFRERITKAQEAGPVDLEFAFPGDYGDPTRQLRIRVQSARSRGVWLFIQRD